MREIERKLKISRTSLRPYRERAEASGKSMDELLKMEDADLHAILSKEDVHRNRDTNRYKFLLANIEDYAQAMTRKYMTYEVLYEDTYCKATDNPYGYTQFKSILQEYEKKNDLKLHNVYTPAREMQFDFAGDPLWVVDTETGVPESNRSGVRSPILHDEFCDCNAVYEDGVLLSGTIKSPGVLWRRSGGI